MNPTPTPEFVEREYNNRALVPDHGNYFSRWERDSDFVRSTLPCELDLRYGPHERNRIDLFPAAKARGTLVFIHGGYWRSLDKSMFSWLAAAWVAAGVNVAMPNYRLAPSVRIDDIVDDAVAAVNWLAAHGAQHGVAAERLVVSGHSAGGHLAAAWVAAGVNVVLPNYRLAPAVRIDDIVDDTVAATNWLFAHGPSHGIAMDRVVVSGHSAGGHLTAALLAAPRDALRFDLARIAGAVPISGVFDFAPLRVFSFNEDFRLDAAAVERLNLAPRAPTIPAPLVIAAGAAESSEFQRQSQLLADAWKPQVKSLLLLQGCNHFSVVDAFSERGQPLYESTLSLFEK